MKITKFVATKYPHKYTIKGHKTLKKKEEAVDVTLPIPKKKPPQFNQFLFNIMFCTPHCKIPKKM